MRQVERSRQLLRIDDHAARAAAARLGVEPEALKAAVAAYREACLDVAEPRWTAISHLSGDGMGIAVYGAEGTDVTMSTHSYRTRSGSRADTVYAFKGAGFETFAEAASFEIRWKTAVARGDEATLDALLVVLDAGA